MPIIKRQAETQRHVEESLREERRMKKHDMVDFIRFMEHDLLQCITEWKQEAGEIEAENLTNLFHEPFIRIELLQRLRNSESSQQFKFYNDLLKLIKKNIRSILNIDDEREDEEFSEEYEDHEYFMKR